MKEFNTSPLKLKLFTILKEITTSLPPPKPELNTSESKDKQSLLEELLLSVDTKLTQVFNKEAELEEDTQPLLPTMLPQPLLPTKLDTSDPPQPLLTKLDTFNLELPPPLIKLDTWPVEVESDKVDTSLAAVELEEPHTSQEATSSPATKPLPTIDPQ